jgi:bifunctional non-homologous end joining protein LigD
LRLSRGLSLSHVPGARKTAAFDYIEPCDPTLRERVPNGALWRFEIKADGYRAQLHIRQERTKVYSRTGLDWTGQFSSIAAAAPELRVETAIIDGEAVVYGSNSVPDFQQLRRELGGHRSPRLRYHAFDLLYCNGYDLRDVAFVERKRLLEELLNDAPETFIYVEDIGREGDEGDDIFRNACKLGLEGLVAKCADAVPRAGRKAGSS